MPIDHASLAPSRRPDPTSALCWREVVRMAFDGWRPAEMRVESLIDWAETAR